MNKSIHLYYWLLLGAICFVFIILQLVQKGMFLDGITYACIARNLATGQCTFWRLQYTPVYYPQFYEHPPLHFFLCSLLFKIFGEHLWIEKLYTFICFLASAFLISRLFKMFAGAESLGFSWVAVLLWLMPPLISWSYTNNMIENTLSVLCLASVLIIVKYMRTNSIPLFVLAAVLVSLAFFTKGFTGLFPFVVPLFYSFLFNKKRLLTGLVQSICLALASLAIILLVIFSNPDAHNFMVHYYREQVLKSLSGNREVSNHFVLIITLVESLSPAVVLCLIIYFTRRNKVNQNLTNTSAALFFLFIAISASFPLMISPKQNGYYLVPSLAFYSLSASLFFLPFFQSVTVWIGTGIRKKYFQIAIGSLLVASVVFCFFMFAKTARDKDMMSDVAAVSHLTGHSATLSAPGDMMFQYGAIAYFKRLADINIRCTNSPTDLFLIAKKEMNVNPGYEKLESVQTHNFYLYKKK